MTDERHDLTQGVKPSPTPPREGARFDLAADEFLERHQGWMTKTEGEEAKSDLISLLEAVSALPTSPAPSSDVWTDEECREAEQTIDDLNEALRFANRRIVKLERRAALPPSQAHSGKARFQSPADDEAFDDDRSD